MKKYLTIWIQSVKFSIQRLFEYRTDFFVWSLVSLGWTTFSLVFYQIMFLQTDTIAGWTKNEVFLLIATYMIIDSATWSIFWRNVQNYTRSIFDGTLDLLLVRPVDAQFRLSTQHISFTNLPRLAIGIYMLVHYLPRALTVQQIVVYIMFILISLIIVYAMWFFTATFAFWVEKLENVIEIVPTMRHLWSTPADVYTGPIAAIFTIIFPVALITTVPTRVLLNTMRWQEIVILLTFTVIVLLSTRFFFNYSIKKYSGAGA